MGSSFSSSRDSLFRPLAFPAPKPSYDRTMNGLEFINNKDGFQDIPITWLCVGADRPTLLFSHGNGCDLGHMQETIRRLVKELDVNIIAYDYQGYGL